MYICTSERPIREKLISANTDNRPNWPILSADNIGHYRPFLNLNWRLKVTYLITWTSKNSTVMHFLWEKYINCILHYCGETLYQLEAKMRQNWAFFSVFLHCNFGRYYRWVGRYYRPIISAVMTDIIGRYIGIGRTLICTLRYKSFFTPIAVIFFNRRKLLTRLRMIAIHMPWFYSNSIFWESLLTLFFSTCHKIDFMV